MSDLNEGPGELPSGLSDFYEVHRETGEPTAAQLGKALLRIHTGTRPAAPMVLSVRRWLPPELLAVAALLLLTIGGGAIGWHLKTEAQLTDALLVEARAAWVAGDLDSAITSLERCSSADCARLATAVKRARAQLKQQGPLGAAEKGSLLALDLELSGGQRSLVADQLSPRAPQSDRDLATAQADALRQQGFPPEVVSRAVALFIAGLEVSESAPDLATRNFREVVALVPGTTLARRAEKRTQALVSPEPESAPAPAPVVEAPESNEALRQETSLLVEQAKVAKRERRYQGALALLERCLALSPNDVECTVILASTHAAKAAEENSSLDNERARALYRRFLLIAPPNDRRISRVKEILQDPPGDAASERQSLEREAHDLYLRGYQLRETAPDEARRLFEEVVRLAPDSVDGQKAKGRIAELGGRPMGRLRIASTPTNARVFVDGIDTGRTTPVLPNEPFEVTPGRHTIYAESGGRRSATTELEVVEGDNPALNLVVH